jgi:hypothetical protein
MGDVLVGLTLVFSKSLGEGVGLTTGVGGV